MAGDRFADLKPAPMPAFPGFRAVLGPGLVWLALAQGSGELIFWPYLIAKFGLAFAILLVPSHLLQFPANLAIGRYTLVTGEPIFKGFLRLNRTFGIVLWVWMLVLFLWIGGWASAGGTALADMTRWPGDWSHRGRTLLWGYLLMAGFLAALLLGRVVYTLVERFMSVVAVVTLVGLFWACSNPVVRNAAPSFFGAMVWPAAGLAELPAWETWTVREWNFFMTAICFAGLGGFWTLFYSYWIREKGYGMARYAGHITSPVTGQAEEIRLEGFRLADTPQDRERFGQWMRALRADTCVGVLGNLLTTTLTCLLAWAVLHPQGKVPEKWDIAVVQADFFGSYWPPARVLFLFVAGFFLIDAWLAGVDAVSRVHAHMVCDLSPRARTRGVRFWYYFFLVAMAAATAITMPQGDPATIMAVSGVANLLGITVYSVALYWLTAHALRRGAPAWALPGRLEVAALWGATLVYGALGLLYLRRVVWPLLAAAMAIGVVAVGAASAVAQDAAVGPGDDRPRVFLDCREDCFEDYVRTEITFVDYVRDRADADVQVLVTTQQTGAGGREYTLALIGQGRFADMSETLRHLAEKDEPEERTRRGLAHVLKLGFVRYAAKTTIAPSVVVSATGRGPARRLDDPWRSWVFAIRGEGEIEGEESTREAWVEVSLAADRVTPDWKINLAASASHNEETFDVEGREVVSTRRFRDLSTQAVRSLGPHWSVGLSSGAWSNTFENTSRAVRAGPAIEYSLFPYDESTRRQLVARYRLELRHVRYLEETLFEKTRETLGRHELEMRLEQREAWGSVLGELELSQYVHDAGKYRIEIEGEASLRLVKGLSLTLAGRASRVRDRLSLPRRGASAVEILLEQRQLASGYEYGTSAALTYTFGSIFNNVVNPRFVD